MNATIKLLGPDSSAEAEALYGTLVRAGLSAKEPQVTRSEEIIALISLALSGVQTATTIWEWWEARKKTGTKVQIVLSDGSQLDLGTTDLNELTMTLAPNPPPGGLI